jgi:glycosyltransferase involved in cell wall biosynthesis
MALAVELGVAERVVMRGQLSREQVPALLRSVDAVVCTPWYEPFGIVPLEAMACGRPVVAAAVGGLNDSIVHGLTGLHVRPRNPQEVAEALAVILGNPVLARQLGERGVQRVQARYTWDKVAATTEKIYTRMVSARDRTTLQGEATDGGARMEGRAQ